MGTGISTWKVIWWGVGALVVLAVVGKGVKVYKEVKSQMIAKGQIVDSKTQDILPQATIFVTDGEGNVIDDSKRESADKEGIFSIDVFPSDFLTISYVGYHNKTVSIKDFNSGINIINLVYNKSDEARSEARRVGKECRYRWSPYN